MLCNSTGEISRASMTSRLSSRSFGNSSKRSSKKCIRSRRPSQMRHVKPRGSSVGAVRPTSSAYSHRAAASGVSPCRTPPPGKCHPARYEQRTSKSAAPMWTATATPSCRGRVRRHQIRASGNPTRKAVRQAKSRSDASGARPRPDMAETFIKRPRHLKRE